MKRRFPAAATLACALWPASAIAQDNVPPAVNPRIFSSAAIRDAVASGLLESPDRDRLDAAGREEAARRCEGCPARRLVRPYLESLALDVMYNGINHLRGHPTADVGPRSWWRNLRHGFEWDDNPWGVNQIGHPYQGSNYYTSGRAHGLTFWESAPVAAFGSATWEYFAENNRASLNDLINTTLGGIALGEVMHRLGWVIRDPTLTGRKRSRKELIATAIDPMGGLQRFMSGDSKRVAQKPSDLVPSSVTYGISAGAMWQGRNARQSEAAEQPFMQIDVNYGDVRTGRNQTPFGAFELAFQSRGGNPVAGLAIRGRFVGRPFGPDGRAQFSVFQTYDYLRNRAYAFGGQGVEVEVAIAKPLSPSTSLWMAATGGTTLLGAVDTLVNPPPGAVVDPALLARRAYDYGPTFRFGGVLELQRRRLTVARFSYQGYQLNVVDGARSFHVLQRFNADLHLPINNSFSLGIAGEYFFRKAYFWPEGNRTDQSPQVRVFATWRQR